MKTPVLNEVHKRSGAKIAEFAGWMLPIDYGSAIKEINAVRTAVGLFDVSHMGRLFVKGPGALEALQKLLTNDLSKLVDGGGQYTLMCNPSGGVIDDLIIFRRGEDDFYVVVNASNLEKDKEWIIKHLPESVILTDKSPETALIAVQGPAAIDLLVKTGLTAASETKRFHMVTGQVAGRDVLATRTGYTGEDGFEIACKNEDAEAIWTTLISEGEEFGVAPCGLAARDVLRTEACLPLYGHEIDDTITPVEAGLMRWVNLDKGEFIGREPIAKMLNEGLKRKLIGIIMEGRVPPRAEDKVVSSAGEGVVTSGTFSPTLGCGIAMAYLPAGVEEGQKVDVIIHGKPRPGTLKNVPLYSRKKK